MKKQIILSVSMCVAMGAVSTMSVADVESLKDSVGQGAEAVIKTESLCSSALTWVSNSFNGAWVRVHDAAITGKNVVVHVKDEVCAFPSRTFQAASSLGKPFWFLAALGACVYARSNYKAWCNERADLYEAIEGALEADMDYLKGKVSVCSDGAQAKNYARRCLYGPVTPGIIGPRWGLKDALLCCLVDSFYNQFTPLAQRRQQMLNARGQNAQGVHNAHNHQQQQQSFMIVNIPPGQQPIGLVGGAPANVQQQPHAQLETFNVPGNLKDTYEKIKRHIKGAQDVRCLR